MGGKGGGGKSTLMTSLVDFFHAENCPVTLIDCDTENKVHGSFSHFFKEALKVDITTPSGFDEFVEKVLCDNAPMVLADLGAGSGKFTFKWFDDMHDPLQEAGVRFLAIGVLTSEVARRRPSLIGRTLSNHARTTCLCAIIATVMISVLWNRASPDSGS